MNQNMGDNSVERFNANHSSEEDECVIEEYEEYYVPSHLVKEDEIAVASFNNLETHNVPTAQHEQQTVKPVKLPPKVKTITRVDEETENVVILIRPRRRSISEERQDTVVGKDSTNTPDKDESETAYIDKTDSIGKDEKKFADMDKTVSTDKDRNEAAGIDKTDGNDRDGNKANSNTNENNNTDGVSFSIPSDSSLKDNRDHSVTKECLNCAQTSLDNNMSVCECHNSAIQIDPEIGNNKDHNGNRTKSDYSKLKYERQGARPKVSATHNTAMADVGDAVHQVESITPFSRPGISQEVSEKVRKLKETGDFDKLVKNCNISGNKGVIHNIAVKLNTDKSDSEITEEDDILILNLMKALKEKSKYNEFGQGDKFEDNNFQPGGKCDWSYEKATLSKDKYLSRRLQTKEKGQVKVITFMSPSKEKKAMEITPIKVTRTLPFNVKHIFQQKMEELKNKDRICLTGGKELMFTNINIDRLNCIKEQT